LFDIYICVYCSGPIIFRGGHAHDIYHVGTGWYCWKDRQKAEEEFFGKFELKTPKDLRNKLVEKAKELYSEYLRKRNPKTLLRFLDKELRAKRADVVRGFLRHVAMNDHPANELLVRGLILLPAWRRFARGKKR
jgi:transposase